MTLFQKGQSGNPAGVSSEVAKLANESRSAAAKLCPMMISALHSTYLELVGQTEPQLIKLRIIVMKEILDRGIGKPLQSMQIESSLETKRPYDMTSDELNMFIQGDFFGAVRKMHSEGKLEEILNEGSNAVHAIKAQETCKQNDRSYNNVHTEVPEKPSEICTVAPSESASKSTVKKNRNNK